VVQKTNCKLLSLMGAMPVALERLKGDESMGVSAEFDRLSRSDQEVPLSAEDFFGSRAVRSPVDNRDAMVMR
jgi:hypothetical protein